MSTCHRQRGEPNTGSPARRRDAQFNYGQKPRNLYARASPRTIHAGRFVEELSPACLRQLKRSARQGGPDLQDIRGSRSVANQPLTIEQYGILVEARGEMSSSQSSSRRRKRGSRSPAKKSSNPLSKSSTTPNTTSTKSTGPYDRAFQQHLIDHAIFPHGGSLSPSKFTTDDFRKFERADAHAAKERDVTTTVIPVIEGNAGDRKSVAGQIPFTNLDHLTDGTLVPGNPDLYYGARPEQLDRTVRSELNRMIIPSTQQDLPIVPNFSLAVKGPDGSLSVATRQACYDGALGARAIHSVQSYGEVPRLDNKAYAITSVYHGGQLKMYTCHPIPASSPNRGCGFVMTQIKTWGLTGDADTFRQGAGAYRNLRDWAKKDRDNAIEEANGRVPRNIGASPSQDAEGLTSSFTSEASVADTIITSQTTVIHTDSNAQITYESDSSDDPLPRDFTPVDFEPPAKRTKSRSRSPRKPA
ncbi:hypothetical protein Purlil1_13962 [Purpureocillium lilacinum]|uniref:Uncharacterized protein n=1 Tax=Purpureocillium lilacinum TaxID=33203 RepID=A0ABR0BCN7_PURLI|nr:hypothetical protein Purlil1_13962 [Purpureocillium lilacinum]